VCNRDERRTRPDALGPSLRRVRGRTAAFPLDPLSGGTWIGINDAGLVLALLNRTVDAVAVDRPRRSRGIIIPPLLAHDTLDAVVERANRIVPGRFEPFRLVAVQGTALAVVTSDGHELYCEAGAMDRPLMFTSSSLGDVRVEWPRRELFERMVVRAPVAERGKQQDRYHRHRWRARPALSVLMARQDARTVSRTVVEIQPGRISLRYQALRQGH
jgi:uncharacterized protein with NRDE domain